MIINEGAKVNNNRRSESKFNPGYGFLIIFTLFITFIGCRDQADQNQVQDPIPPAGMILADDSTESTIDELNSFPLRVQISATEIKDVYLVMTGYGPNEGSTEIRMPAHEPLLLPELKEEGTDMIIGFRTSPGGTFYPYYKITASAARTEILPLKSYKFE